MFVSEERLHEQRPQPRKIALGSSPGENPFVTQKLSTVDECRLHQNCLFQRGDYSNEANKSEDYPVFEFR
jgi:hypothetical protein